MYLLLRDQGVTRRDALLGSACLGAYPIYFVLSFSFMTDVPFVVVADTLTPGTCMGLARDGGHPGVAE
jgi:hypothetical protein